MSKTSYQVGDTVTITQDMEDEAARTDSYVLVRREDEVIGTPGMLQEIERQYEEEKAQHPRVPLRVVPFTRSPFVLARAFGKPHP